MEFVMDSVMEVFYTFRLGRTKEDERRVLYYNALMDELSKVDMDELPEQDEESKRLVLVSDTHDRYRGLNIPKGDVFIHAGDILMTSRKLSKDRGYQKLQDFNDWLGTLDFTHKIVIAGNHDRIIESLGAEKTQEVLHNAKYLENDCVHIDSLRFFGCPLSSGASKNDSFQSSDFCRETLEVVKNVSTEAVDIFISHGPNFEMAKALKPKLHVWGHAHHYYGVYKPGQKVRGSIFSGLSACPSIMTTRYDPTNLPIVIDYSTSKSAHVGGQSVS